MIFLQIWGMWGKTAINVFVMITGYFMCQSRLTVKRIAKIYLETKFYTIIIFIILSVCGYEQVILKSLFKMLFGNAYGIGHNFTASFLVFYLFIPFYNILLNKLDKREHLRLISLLLIIYTGTSTFFFNGTVFSEPVWYMVVYFVAAYIKMYGKETWLENNKVIVPVLTVLVGIAYASVLTVDYLGSKVGFKSWSYMVSDSNKLLAFLIGAGAFLLFNNIKIQYSRIINTVASTMFGVLCIHANSDAMRFLLWKKILNVTDMYTASLDKLMIHAILSLVIIFIICIVIDMVRIKFIEKPVMDWLEKYKWFNREL